MRHSAAEICRAVASKSKRQCRSAPVSSRDVGEGLGADIDMREAAEIDPATFANITVAPWGLVGVVTVP